MKPYLRKRERASEWEIWEESKGFENTRRKWQRRRRRWRLSESEWSSSPFFFFSLYNSDFTKQNTKMTVRVREQRGCWYMWFSKGFTVLSSNLTTRATRFPKFCQSEDWEIFIFFLKIAISISTQQQVHQLCTQEFTKCFHTKKNI